MRCPSQPIRVRHRLPLVLAVFAGLALIAGGCRADDGAPTASDTQPENSALVPANTFRAVWTARLPVDDYGSLEELFLREDMVIAYTDENIVYVLSAAGGRNQWIATDVVGPRDRLWPPVLLAALNRFGPGVNRVLAFPSNTSYLIYNDDGTRIQETVIDRGERAITSPSFGENGQVFVGLADRYGGRAARIDPSRVVNPVIRPTLLKGVVGGRPVAFQGTFFVADQEGNVYGITEAGTQAWNRNFDTGGSVAAALTADDYGLYVPGTDSVFYVLDRATGRIKWTYYAEVPLYRPAFPTDRYIFLPIEGRGVACLSKLEGRTIGREPLWLAAGAREILSHDEQNVYLLHDDGSIVAHSKATGQELFRSRRDDFTTFARNTTGADIFAGTLEGEIVCIRPVLTRGQVGDVVRGATTPADAVLASTSAPR